MMNVYDITVPIYAESKEEALNAQKALYAFIDNYRQRGIAVSGNKISQAMTMLESSSFAKFQIENFLTR